MGKTSEPPKDAARRGSAGRSFLLGLTGLLLLGVGFAAGRLAGSSWWRGVPSVTPVPPTPEPQPLPSLAAAAPSSSLSPQPVPSGTPSSAVVAEAAAPPPRARQGSSARKPSVSGAPSETSTSGVPEPDTPIDPGMAARPFVLGTSAVESLKEAGPDLPGFDTTGIGVKRAPEVPGRIAFEVSPARVRGGDRYAVKVFLINDGKKAIAIQEMKVALTTDGKRAARNLPPRARQIAPRQRALVAELPGVWKEGLASWALEVVVTSKRQDQYRNILDWK